jgi:hypothetical protein
MAQDQSIKQTNKPNQSQTPKMPDTSGDKESG